MGCTSARPVSGATSKEPPRQQQQQQQPQEQQEPQNQTGIKQQRPSLPTLLTSSACEPTIEKKKSTHVRDAYTIGAYSQEVNHGRMARDSAKQMRLGLTPRWRRLATEDMAATFIQAVQRGRAARSKVARMRLESS